MRKTLALLVVLTLLSGYGIYWANTTVGKEIDNVKWKENVIIGDKSMAEGVTIQRNAKYKKYMYWDTTYVIGEEPSIHTDFQFSVYGMHENRERINYTGLKFQMLNSYYYQDNLNGTTSVYRSGLTVALDELKEEAPAGKRTTKRIALKDYEEYYGFEMDVKFPNCYFSGDQEGIRNYFKIPVLEDEIYWIGVEKDDKGNILGYGYASKYVAATVGNFDIDCLLFGDSFVFDNSSVITEDKVYFTFSTLTEEGNIIDTSQIQGGYGIYSFKYDKELNKIDVSSLKLEYALEPSGFVNLEIDAEKENLLIFTEDEKQFYLTVVDVDTMETKQILSYGAKDDNSLTRWYEVREDYIIAQYDYYEAILLSKEEDGTYKESVVIPGKVETGSNEVYLLSTTNAFDWNGEKLVIATDIGRWVPYYTETCGVAVAVIDASGVSFYAEYESSLDTNVGDTGNNYGTCEPRYYNSLSISWN